MYQGTTNPKQITKTDYFYDGINPCVIPSNNKTPELGNLTRIAPWNDDSAHFETLLSYDNRGNIICRRDPNNNMEQIGYDSRSEFATSYTNALGQRSQMTYYGVDTEQAQSGLYGQPKSNLDANNAVTEMKYDVFGRKIEVLRPDGTSTFFSYQNFGDPNNQFIQASSASGTLTIQQYFDGLGRPTKLAKTGPDSRAIVRQDKYENRGFLAARSLPYFEGQQQPKFQTFTYDEFGRPQLIQNADGTKRLSCYDAGVSVTIDENLHRTRVTSDVSGQITKVEQYKGLFSECTADREAAANEDLESGSPAKKTPYATTTYNYDIGGNLTQVIDANSKQVTLQYDHLNRRIRLADPNSGSKSFLYDPNGNLLKVTDGANQSIYLSYDALNRLSSKNYNKNKEVKKSDVIYSYDAATFGVGRLASVKTRDLLKNFSYNQAGQLTRIDQNTDGHTYTTKYGFDNIGRIDSLTYPDGDTLHYKYNGPFVDSIFDNETTYVKYTDYNALGQAGVIGYGNKLNTSFTFSNAANNNCRQENFRLCSLKTTSPTGEVLEDNFYSYDSAGNVVSLDRPGERNYYVVDEFNRLLATAKSTPQIQPEKATLDALRKNPPTPENWKKVVSGSTDLKWSSAYSYDEGGNITWNSEMGRYLYSAANHPQAVSKAGAQKYGYDKKGNMIRGAGRVFAYDVENRLVSANLGPTTTTFSYDDQGNRFKKLVQTKIVKTVKLKNGKTTKQIVTAQRQTVYVGDIYECTSGTCNKHIWAGEQLLAQKAVKDKTIHYYTHDHLGSTTFVTNSQGKVVRQATYRPYGVNVAENNVSTLQDEPLYEYTGKEYDASTHLYYYNSRYYDPQIGRFLSPDSILPIVGATAYLNQYAYALNNPIIFNDPDGHFGFLAILIGVAIGAVIGGTAAAIRHENIWKGALVGGIAGAFTGGAGALIGPGTGVALQATLYAMAGAASGAVGAAIYGRDVGTGALFGAGFGLAGFAIGGIDVTLANAGVPLSHLMASAAKGAFLGGAFAAVRGSNVWEGIASGAEEGAIGAYANELIGNIVGKIASHGREPKWEKGFWIYEIPKDGLGYGKGWVSIGNSIIGSADSSVRSPYLSDEYTADLNGEPKKFTYMQHEVGHSVQNSWLGPWYLPMHGLSMIVGGIRGDIHTYGPLEGYSPWHPAPLQK